MAKQPDPQLRAEGFRKAEASLKLEGMDPCGTPLYESIKARIVSGDLTYEQGRLEIMAHYTAVAGAVPVTVGDVIVTNGAIVIHTQRLKSDPGGNLLS